MRERKREKERERDREREGEREREREAREREAREREAREARATSYELRARFASMAAHSLRSWACYRRPIGGLWSLYGACIGGLHGPYRGPVVRSGRGQGHVGLDWDRDTWD